MMVLAAFLAAQAPVQPPIVVTAPPVTRARVRSGSLSDRDYPRAALRAGAEGQPVVRFQVGVNGRVGACEVETSGGHEALDSMTCTIVRRLVFTPARAADGQAVAQWLRFSIRYALPRNLTVFGPDLID